MRHAPEVVTGAREPRGPETVQPKFRVSAESGDFPQAPEAGKSDEVVFVSRYREYTITVFSEPDRVDHTGAIIKGRDRKVRFNEYTYRTSDPTVIAKIRALPQYGLGVEVWEKSHQDAAIAEKAMRTAEEALSSLSEEQIEALRARLGPRFGSFPLPNQTKEAATN